MEAIEHFIGLDSPFITVILFFVACKFVIELIQYFWELGKKHYQEQVNTETEKKSESESIEELKEEVKHIKENRVHDREQSLQIQKQLVDGQNKLNEALTPMLIEHKQVMKTLDCLSDASRETLANKINEKYKEYMDKGYIPADEFDEFVNLHDAYKGLGGNHSGDMKFNRCMKLPTQCDNEYDKKDEEVM